MKKYVDMPDRDGLIADIVAAIRTVPEIVPDPRQARLLRGILERQIIMMARLNALEDELDPSAKKSV